MHSYITPDKVFAHLDRIQSWRDGLKPAPVTIEWDLTNVCSRGCGFCHMAYTHTKGPLAGVFDGPPGSTSTGHIADTAMVIRALTEAKSAGVQGVVWTGGGEPTLHPQFEEIIAHAAQMGLSQGMYSHGGHISEGRAAFIKQHFTWVVISMDRADAESYRAYKGGGKSGFDKACEGVRNLSAASGPCTVGVSFLLDEDSWQDAWKGLKLANSLGADYTTFRPMINFQQDDPALPIEDRSWITTALPTLMELSATASVVLDVDRFLEYQDYTGRNYKTCRGIRLNTTITPDGRMWLCPNRRGFAGSELGDLSKESFSSIWSRHPGTWEDFSQCRVMCRLHLVNERLDIIERPMQHQEFV